jgi:hypothetical protein
MEDRASGAQASNPDRAVDYAQGAPAPRLHPQEAPLAGAPGLAASRDGASPALLSAADAPYTYAFAAAIDGLSPSQAVTGSLNGAFVPSLPEEKPAWEAEAGLEGAAVEAPIPEIPVWAMMVLGFAGVGLGIRSRRKRAPRSHTDDTI